MSNPIVPAIESGYRCESGAERERNEDSCLVLTSEFGGHFPMLPVGLYVVADGMGGEREGHVASNMATRAFGEYVLTNLYFPLLREYPEPREAGVLDTLERAVFAAHDAVLRPETRSTPGGNGGTTLTAGLLWGRRLYIAHVGDSRAYLLSGEDLRPLTEDHSLVRRLQETGRLSAEDAQNFQYRNVLLQALGQEGALTADTFSLDLPDSGKLLLCSDGLCGLVRVEEMAGILLAEGSAQLMADRLYQAAMAAGGYDNITAVVVDFAF
jgi:serine/threonine protein phosphatase PrpC